MAIQLATYRLFGKQVATYESTQTRFFLHGRTETTRAVSPESNKFVKVMNSIGKDDENSRIEKLSCLKSAVWTHSKSLNKSSKGLGCDRHFFGLSKLLENSEHLVVVIRR